MIYQTQKDLLMSPSLSLNSVGRPGVWSYRERMTRQCLCLTKDVHTEETTKRHTNLEGTRRELVLTQVLP